MTEQSPQYLAPAPAKYLTLVYRIESPQQKTELLAQSGWVANSHSDAIQERDALQRRVNSMEQEIERLQQRLKNVNGYHQAWFAHAQELEKQLEAVVGTGGVEPLRRSLDETRRLQRQLGEMALLIGQMICDLRNVSPGNEGAKTAVDYLKRIGLQSSPLHQIVEPALAVSTVDCKGPLCGCPEYGGGHHSLCKHATPKSAEPQQKPVQEPTAQSFTRGMQILQWNRAQEKPPIAIARELWVASELEHFYISGQPLTDERKEQATISQCQCKRCLRDRNEGTTLGPLFLPAEATQMIVCPVCGDKRCIHVHDHEAPCAKADLYGHNLWVAHHLEWLTQPSIHCFCMVVPEAFVLHLDKNFVVL